MAGNNMEDRNEESANPKAVSSQVGMQGAVEALTDFESSVLALEQNSARTREWLDGLRRIIETGTTELRDDVRRNLEVQKQAISYTFEVTALQKQKEMLASMQKINNPGNDQVLQDMMTHTEATISRGLLSLQNYDPEIVQNNRNFGFTNNDDVDEDQNVDDDKTDEEDNDDEDNDGSKTQDDDDDRDKKKDEEEDV